MFAKDFTKFQTEIVARFDAVEEKVSALVPVDHSADFAEFRASIDELKTSFAALSQTNTTLASQVLELEAGRTEFEKNTVEAAQRLLAASGHSPVAGGSPNANIDEPETDPRKRALKRIAASIPALKAQFPNIKK